MRPASATQKQVRRLTEAAFGEGLHHKQVLSLSMIVLGVVRSERLGVAAVGRAMAQAHHRSSKHGVKQVDRFLSNPKLPPELLSQQWVPVVIGSRRRVSVAMDWTDFDHDDHTTLPVSLITRGRRTVPLLAYSVHKSTLKGKREASERHALGLLRDAIPDGVRVVIVADRGFGDIHLQGYLTEELDFDFVIRFRSNIYLHWGGRMRKARELVPRNGRKRLLRRTYITAQQAGPWNVVLYKASGMKDDWCLATSLDIKRGDRAVSEYARRFQCEETFRDLKDRRYGLGLSLCRIADCTRRDRLLLVFSVAYLFLLLLGKTSETLGLDRQQRANTETRRTHSLFQQGLWLLRERRPEVERLVRPAFGRAFALMLATGFPNGLACGDSSGRSPDRDRCRNRRRDRDRGR
jgi:hypothetical protein